MNNEAIARAFFASWAKSFEAMCAAFEDSCAPHCVWDQRPMALTRSVSEAVEFLHKSRRLLGLATIDVEVLKLASDGNTVLCERVDHLRKRDGRLIASAPVAGVLDFQNGKIVRWREYYDPLDLMKQTVVNGVRGALSRRSSA